MAAASGAQPTTPALTPPVIVSALVTALQPDHRDRNVARAEQASGPYPEGGMDSLGLVAAPSSGGSTSRGTLPRDGHGPVLSTLVLAVGWAGRALRRRRSFR
ncbi:MAG: hypothetical protein ACYCTI_01420 [Acidimicrobiales bacterium]